MGMDLSSVGSTKLGTSLEVGERVHTRRPKFYGSERCRSRDINHPELNYKSIIRVQLPLLRELSSQPGASSACCACCASALQYSLAPLGRGVKPRDPWDSDGSPCITRIHHDA
jgi:hypothetical protein